MQLFPDNLQSPNIWCERLPVFLRPSGTKLHIVLSPFEWANFRFSSTHHGAVLEFCLRDWIGKPNSFGFFHVYDSDSLIDEDLRLFRKKNPAVTTLEISDSATLPKIDPSDYGSGTLAIYCPVAFYPWPHLSFRPDGLGAFRATQMSRYKKSSGFVLIYTSLALLRSDHPEADFFSLCLDFPVQRGQPSG
jgi:hypothetical protein